MDLLRCMLNVAVPALDAQTVLQDFKSKNIKQAAKDLKAMFHDDIPAAIDLCDVVSDDVKATVKEFRDANITSIKDLEKHIKENFKEDDKDEIMSELETVIQHFPKDEDVFGNAMGMFLHHLIIGKYPDEKSITV